MQEDFRRLFAPRGVAVVGASADPSRIGGQPIRALTRGGYAGGIYPVNPRRDEVQGLRCYRDVKEVPEPCDVALVAVAAPHVAGVIESCGERGIPFAIVLSSGFGEVGGEGHELEASLETAIRRSGVRIIGPNCQGVLNLRDRVYNGFGSIFQRPELRVGEVAMATQSGGFGYAVVGLAEYAGVGFNYVASTGNEADIDTTALLAWFLEQDEVEVVASYMEGVRDGRRLLEVGRRALDLGKPILVWKVGNSDLGRRAAASHTANLTAGYDLYRTAFREGAFIEVRDVDDLVDAARAFHARRLPDGRGVAIISISGGAGVLLADRCEEHGLELPSLSQETVDELRALLPAFGSVANPVDVTAQVFNDLGMFNRVVRVVAADHAVHQLIVVNASVAGEIARALAEELVKIAADLAKPILVASSAAPGTAVEAMETLERHAVPCYPTPARAAFGAAALSDLAGRQRRRASTPPLTRGTGRHEIEWPAQPGGLGEHRSKQCLSVYGIPVVRESLVPADQVESLSASPIPFPVAVKLQSPDVSHKTELGAVRLGVNGMTELRDAAREVLDAARGRQPEARLEEVLVQEMAIGLEVIAGAVVDPYFGPLVLVGLGGIFAETIRDVARRFAPFGTETAREMVLELRASPILTGARGRPALDVDALAEALARLSLLVADHADRIAEIDVNPLFVRPAGEGVVAADALVVLREPSPASAAASEDSTVPDRGRSEV